MTADVPGALLLLLLDSRSPAGAHNHSSGMEAAIGVGMVRDLADVEAFCRGRLLTAGAVAADFAAAACRLSRPPDLDALDEPSLAETIKIAGAWAELEAEFEARTPSEAMRDASRRLGRGLHRMVRAMLPGFSVPSDHHPLVLGAAVADAGGGPQLAARAAALGTVAGPASAAVRLLGLDPFAVQAMLARSAIEIDAATPGSVRPVSRPESGRTGVQEGSQLSAYGAPALDLLADFHLTTEVRLFAS